MDPFRDREPRAAIRSVSAVPVSSTPSSSSLFAKPARSLSRIDGMTVGDVRQCFSQMRATPHLTSNTTLWCGLTAGVFALRYLVHTGGSGSGGSGSEAGSVSGGSDKGSVKGKGKKKRG